LLCAIRILLLPRFIAACIISDTINRVILLAELVHFGGDRCKCLGKRIINLPWISDYDTLAVTKDVVTRNAYDCRIIGNIS